MSYKVIFRADTEHPSQEHALTWEPGCPLEIVTLQISRDTESGSAYLQTKYTNISTEVILSFRVHITISYEDHDPETIIFEPLDADIERGGDFTPAAVSLSGSKALFAEAIIDEVTCSNGNTWKSEGAEKAKVLPQPPVLSLSKEALAERKLQLNELKLYSRSSLNPGVETHGIYEKDNWWVCGCGAIHIGGTSCRSCVISKEKLKELESEEYLLDSIEKKKKSLEEKQRTKRKLYTNLKKGSIIGGSIAVFCVIVAAIFLLVIQPAISTALVSEVTYYNSAGDATRTTKYSYNQQGACDKKTEIYYSYDEELDSIRKSPHTTTETISYQFDQNGFPTRAIIQSSSPENSETITYTIKESDNKDRPTLIQSKNNDTTSMVSIKYFNTGRINEIKQEESSSTSKLTRIDQYNGIGFRTSHNYEQEDTISRYFSYDYSEKLTTHYETNSIGQTSKCIEQFNNSNGESRTTTIEYIYNIQGDLKEMFVNGKLFCSYKYTWVPKDSVPTWTSITNSLQATEIPFLK